jgi:hypothetical protein
MVAAHDFSMDLSFCNLFLDTVGYKEVVDTPTGILLARLETV